MNKKFNTFLFVIGATLFNILCVVVCFILLTILYDRLLMNIIPAESQAWGFSFIFMVSIVFSFIIYRFVIKFLVKKIDLEKYFDPIFVRRNLNRNRN